MESHSVIVLTGPTASGKSGLAVELARQMRGVIINADALQVYDGLPILTAQPDAQVQADVPHRLYSVLPMTQRCSAGVWRAMAVEAIGQVLAQGQRPILVGGTGLYLKALMVGIADIPPISDAVRQQARDRLQQMGLEAFRDDLARHDPAASRAHDAQRLVRRYEVWTATGQSLSDWQSRPVVVTEDWRYHSLILMPPREPLYQRINERFQDMIQAGALNEAARVESYDPDLPGMKALGLAPLLAFRRGETSLERATEMAQQASRHYAKRQITWLRHQVIGHMDSADRPDLLVLESLDQAASRAQEWLAGIPDRAMGDC
ncbi:MAG: tRNA (adenosine(37)-N6)-dimethylallyltransferase MiaA [Alphaproteobacteria bacterium]|nr:MAG: tRNA (adenosine(37)-N6)-dimethylallyltransferase MiaA [Alphaproteobacteria bacterium]